MIGRCCNGHGDVNTALGFAARGHRGDKDTHVQQEAFVRQCRPHSRQVLLGVLPVEGVWTTWAEGAPEECNRAAAIYPDPREKRMSHVLQHAKSADRSFP